MSMQSILVPHEERLQMCPEINACPMLLVGHLSPPLQHRVLHPTRPQQIISEAGILNLRT